MIVCPVAFYRIIRAKTRKEYLGNFGLFVGLILTVFAMAELTGIDTGLTELPPPPQDFPNFEQISEKMPKLQLALIIAFALLWLVGGNLLFYFHNRRLGKRWWQTLNLLDPPFKDFNRREWIILGVLFLATLALGIWAVSLSEI